MFHMDSCSFVAFVANLVVLMCSVSCHIIIFKPSCDKNKKG